MVQFHLIKTAESIEGGGEVIKITEQKLVGVFCLMSLDGSVSRLMVLVINLSLMSSLGFLT